MATVDVSAHELPSLPPEIVSAVIKCLSSSTKDEDQAFAWTHCRHVSRQIRKEVEDVFSKVHLPRTDNEDTAIFVPSKDRDRPTRPEVIEAFESLAKTRKNIVTPRHVVWFRDDVNDIEIPYTALYLEAQKILVDWRKLFTLYLGEEQLYKKLTRAWFKEHGEPWALESRALAVDGKVDMGTMMEALTMAGEALKDCRNQARRVRVRRQFQDLTGEPLIANKRYLRMEGAVAKQLHEHRSYQSWAELDEEIPSQGAESDFSKQANHGDHRGDIAEQEEEEYHVTRTEDDDYLEWDNEVDDATDDSDDSSEDPPPRRMPTLEDILAE